MATDFDLFLYNETSQKYVYASQSIRDNSEGFDILFQENGSYDIYAAWPKGNQGCGSSQEALGCAYWVQ